MATTSRRRFLGDLGSGMLAASLGSSFLRSLGAATVPRGDGAAAPPLPLDLERLVERMRESEPDALLPFLVGELRAGTGLPVLVTAGALANARTFGGCDYEGYHAFMALLPALAIAGQLPAATAPLPVLKVLYRNTARIRKAGKGATALTPVDAGGSAVDAAALRHLVRDRDLPGAERSFVAGCRADADHAFADVQVLVCDDLNVHRIVLAWRSWDMLRVAGREQAEPMLRQFVRFCIDEERQRVDKGRPAPAVRDDVPAILDRHGLIGAKATGTGAMSDARTLELARTVFRSARADAADAVAAVLKEGIDAEQVGEAISLGANLLLRHDTGERRVHGASVGLHASDAANAWRNVARVAAPASRVACLVTAAYHTAGQSDQVGREPYSYAEQLERIEGRSAEDLLKVATAAIESRDQRLACGAIARFGELNHLPEGAFDLLRRYAVSEDGALHAEKYFATVTEEFTATRPSLRWPHLVGLARVTASEFGEPAPGVAKARELLGA